MSAIRRVSVDAAQSAALELLRGAERFLLCGHSRPDGDCVGSQAALAHVLASLGKEVRILNPDPIAARYDFLARELDFGAFSGAALPPHDVAVFLDFSELSRTGPLAGPLAAARSKKLLVDHHLHFAERWWDEAYVDAAACATGLLVYRIARALDVPLDRSAAEGVFTALVSDTGWFRYSNTDAETLRVAGELVECGVDPARIFGALHQREEPAHPLAVGRALSRARYHAGGRLAVVALAASEGLDGVELDEVLDLLRAVEAVEVVLLLCETSSGVCRLSARSKTDYDVNALARSFGGGGHRRASGASVPGPLDAALERVLAAAVRQFEVTAG